MTRIHLSWKTAWTPLYKRVGFPGPAKLQDWDNQPGISHVVNLDAFPVLLGLPGLGLRGLVADLCLGWPNLVQSRITKAIRRSAILLVKHQCAASFHSTREQGRYRILKML